MAKRSILTQVRNEKPQAPEPVAPSSDAAPKIRPSKPSRRNTLHIGGYFDPDDPNVVAFQKLKFDLRKTQQDMILEALCDYVAKHEAAGAFR